VSVRVVSWIAFERDKKTLHEIDEITRIGATNRKEWTAGIKVLNGSYVGVYSSCVILPILNLLFFRSTGYSTREAKIATQTIRLSYSYSLARDTSPLFNPVRFLPLA